MGRVFALCAAVVIALVSGSATADEWDRDTLASERESFPGTAEVIAGKFLRHSDAMHEWRVEDRQQQLEAEPDRLDLMDELAVALDKTGRHDEAIAVMERATWIFPNRRWTQANLGTFLVHAGELGEGLTHIERAVEINPDVHYGRERYRALLVRYLLSRGETQRPLMQSEARVERGYAPSGFAAFVLDDADDAPRSEILSAAVAGIEGLMRADDYRSPVLLEALGDLLSAYPHRSAPRRTAASAYLKASEEIGDPIAAEGYLLLAAQALRPQLGVDIDMVKYDLHWDVSDADRWFSQIAEDELQWIADESVDPDAAFAAKYRDDPSTPRGVAEEAPEERPPFEDWTWLLMIPAAGAVLTLVLGRSHAMS